MIPVTVEKGHSSIPSKPPSLELADIFRRYGKEYRAGHRLSGKQLSVMSDIEGCRTGRFGYHLDICDECGHLEYSYNSCRNRHCPRCQGIARRRWVNARLNDLLPIPYYHAVFTLPHTIFPLSLYNKTLIYELLFQSAAETLLQFGNDPKWLGALIGFYGILHTWGGKIWQHLHLHFIVTGGGLSEDGRWIEPKHKGRFLFPVCALSEVFRGKFIEGLKKAYYGGELTIPDQLRYLEREEEFERWIDILVARNWVVYSKSPFDTPQSVVRYIGRYTHRVAISNDRLISMDDGKIKFKYRDYKNKGVWRTAILTAEEFIKRFLMHVLPDGFHRIRHYGILANGRCKAKVKQIRSILSTEGRLSDEPSAARDLEILSGITCPACGKGKLRTAYTVYPFGIILSGTFIALFGNTALDTS